MKEKGSGFCYEEGIIVLLAHGNLFQARQSVFANAVGISV